MTQAYSSDSQGMPLDRLISDALGQLKHLGYSKNSLYRYRTVWKRLLEFSQEKRFGDSFSEDGAARFVEEYCLGEGKLPGPGQEWRRYIEPAIRVLVGFAHDRRIEPQQTNNKNLRVLPAMKGVLCEYEKYCKDRLLLRPATLRPRITELTVFLHFLGQRNIERLAQIQVSDLSEFVSSRSHLTSQSVARIMSYMRCFLRFLALRGITPKDFSLELPQIRVHRDAHIPSVWDPELIDKLLEVIDRSSIKGKRDYAIILLACRLGLRVGDIRGLQLDHINWKDSSIEITQSKTNVPLNLPLTEEVGQALIDYLRSGRPKTTHRHIFLKLNPPFEPFTGDNLYHIVTYWRCLAGITFRSRHHRGLHSLRHSLATRLLREDTPFHTISTILGHVSPEMSFVYAKADVESLRRVALDPEEVHHG